MFYIATPFSNFPPPPQFLEMNKGRVGRQTSVSKIISIPMNKSSQWEDENVNLRQCFKDNQFCDILYMQP